MPETQNVEYKSSWHNDYLKWICGFANAQGGRIYIGKDDAGKNVGVEDYKNHSSHPRNPILAGACFLGGYIDSWGSGIMKIINSCKAAGQKK